MYFPLFDWQYPKETFLKYPLLYEKGMTYSEYGNKHFIKWFVMAVLHALVIYICLFLTIESYHTQMDNG